MEQLTEPQIVEIEKYGHTFYAEKSEKSEGFWEKVKKDLWEPQTYAIFDTFLNNDHSYLDIGAWIGPTALFGAMRAKHCYALEPDPVAFEHLKRNISLNPHLFPKVTLSEVCLSDSCGKVAFGSNTSDIGGDSNSSLLFGKSGVTSWEVKATTLEKYFEEQKIEDCNFLKIDIEGGESQILPHTRKILERYRPTLYLSMHPPLFQNKVEEINRIWEVIELYPYIYNWGGHRVFKKQLTKEENLNYLYELICTDIPLKELKGSSWDRIIQKTRKGD